MARVEYTAPLSRQEAAAAYPPPWRVVWIRGLSRARILDAVGYQVVADMNLTKAQIIVAAVNRDAATADMLAALKAVVTWYGEPPHEAAPAIVKARAAIAKAEA